MPSEKLSDFRVIDVDILKKSLIFYQATEPACWFFCYFSIYLFFAMAIAQIETNVSVTATVMSSRTVVESEHNTQVK